MISNRLKWFKIKSKPVGYKQTYKKNTGEANKKRVKKNYYCCSKNDS